MEALLAGTDPNLSLLDYQNTTSEGVGSSPAKQLFGQNQLLEGYMYLFIKLVFSSR